MLQHFSKFFDKFQFVYPHDASITMTFSQCSLKIPSFATKTFAIIGASAFLYFSFKCVGNGFAFIWRFIKTRFSALKVLEKDNENVFAAIYGACSPLGIAVAQYLVMHEYSVLLIDNQQKDLDAAYEEIKSSKHSIPTKCEILSFNFDSCDDNMSTKIRDVFSHCPQIKIFINCKSTIEETTKLTKFHTEQDDKLSSVLSNTVKGGIILTKRVLSNMYKHKEGMMVYLYEDTEANSNVLSVAVHSCMRSCLANLKKQYAKEGIKFINVGYHKDQIKTVDSIHKTLAQTFRYIGVYNEIKI
jgi:NADP-dependent 3-hydroxy acid dehydrogenase YdfG